MKHLEQKIYHRYFPTKNDLKSEIINLSAILNLPKGTEEFVSDIHGEFDAFNHILRNGSGNIKQKIQDNFSQDLTGNEQKELAFLVYYPKSILAQKKSELKPGELAVWYEKSFILVVELLKIVGRKYTRSKVRKALDPDFVYITEELLYTDEQDRDKTQYYQDILANLVKLNIADNFIIATANAIQSLVVDHLHVIGDIYDRGPAPEKIVELLMQQKNVDIQWGNHDILWIGSAAGSALSIANLIRIAARYGNLSIIEDNYGINLRHLASFADQHYRAQVAFAPKLTAHHDLSDHELDQNNKIQQAMAIIQFKLEGHAIKRRPEFGMDDRLLLDKIDFENKTIVIDGITYTLTNTAFDTIDRDDPYRLTHDEDEIIDGLIQSFVNATKLRRHLDFLLDHGSMYLNFNDNLLIHGCVPVTENGDFAALSIDGHDYSGRALFEFLEKTLRESYQNPGATDDLATDLVWYLWTGPLSPLFGKKAMKTFERYFIDDKDTHIEVKNRYYELRHDENFVTKLLEEFGIDPQLGHVINGHTPVKKGHSPVMANGKMFVIDGGMSKPYQKTTGIGGYTLLANSHGFQLVTHQPFTSTKEAIDSMSDIVSTRRVVENSERRLKVADTTVGKNIKEEIAELEELLREY